MDHLDVLRHSVPKFRFVPATHHGTLDFRHLSAQMHQMPPHRTLTFVYPVTCVANVVLTDYSIPRKRRIPTATHVPDVSPQTVHGRVRLVALRTIETSYKIH